MKLLRLMPCFLIFVTTTAFSRVTIYEGNLDELTDHCKRTHSREELVRGGHHQPQGCKGEDRAPADSLAAWSHRNTVEVFVSAEVQLLVNNCG